MHTDLVDETRHHGAAGTAAGFGARYVERLREIERIHRGQEALRWFAPGRPSTSPPRGPTPRTCRPRAGHHRNANSRAGWRRSPQGSPARRGRSSGPGCRPRAAQVCVAAARPRAAQARPRRPRTRCRRTSAPSRAGPPRNAGTAGDRTVSSCREASQTPCRAVVRSVLDDQLLDQMVAKMRADGVRLSGPGAFLTEMLKAVLRGGSE